jgi:hypothetical protein
MIPSRELIASAKGWRPQNNGATRMSVKRAPQRTEMECKNGIGDAIDA